jgi:hypothetical protein
MEILGQKELHFKIKIKYKGGKMETSIDIIYAELYEILKHINKEKVALIPQSIILQIINNRNINYTLNINWSDEIDMNLFSKDTINILGYFNYMYWTEDASQKEILGKIYKENRKETLGKLGNVSNEENVLKDNLNGEISLVEIKNSNKISFIQAKKYINDFIKKLFNRK